MNSLYNEKMEALISAALMDGVLTEKEKQILFKKAQEQGIDLDEFEMVLDARLVELQKAEQEKAEKKAAEKSAAPKSQRATDVRKCPVCGCVVPAFAEDCPDCGHHFSSFETTAAAKELEAKINQVYAEAEEQKHILLEERLRISKQVETDRKEILKKYSAREEEITAQYQSKDSGGFFSDIADNIKESYKKNKNQKAMDAELERASMPLTTIDKQIKEIDSKISDRIETVVMAFPIPTSKADLFEFLTSMKERGFNGKYKEALNKAETLFATDPLFTKFIQERKEAVIAIDAKLIQLESQLIKQEKKYQRVLGWKKAAPWITIGTSLFIIVAEIILFSVCLDWAWWGTLLINIPIVAVIGGLCFILLEHFDDEKYSSEKHPLQLAISKTKKDINKAQQERKELI